MWSQLISPYSQYGLSMVLSGNSLRSHLFLSTLSVLTHHSLSTVSALSQIDISVSLSYGHKSILQKFQLVWAVTLSSYRDTGMSKILMGTSIDRNGVAGESRGAKKPVNSI